MEILLSAFSYLTQCKSIPCISDGLASFSPATTVKIWKNVTQRLGAGRAFTYGVTTVKLMGVYAHRKPSIKPEYLTNIGSLDFICFCHLWFIVRVLLCCIWLDYSPLTLLVREILHDNQAALHLTIVGVMVQRCKT